MFDLNDPKRDGPTIFEALGVMQMELDAFRHLYAFVMEEYKGVMDENLEMFLQELTREGKKVRARMGKLLQEWRASHDSPFSKN